MKISSRILRNRSPTLYNESIIHDDICMTHRSFSDFWLKFLYFCMHIRLRCHRGFCKWVQQCMHTHILTIKTHFQNPQWEFDSKLIFLLNYCILLLKLLNAFWVFWAKCRGWRPQKWLTKCIFKTLKTQI